MNIKPFCIYLILSIVILSCEEKVDEDSLPQLEAALSSQALFPGSNSYVDLSRSIDETGATNVSIKTQPQKGGLKFDQSHWLKYSPYKSFTSGNDQFEIDFKDDTQRILRTEVFTMNVINDSTNIPCFSGALGDWYWINRDDELIADVLANDGICEDEVDELSLSIIEAPAFGFAQVDVNNNITYEFDFSKDSVATDTLVYSLHVIDNNGVVHNSAAELWISFFDSAADTTWVNPADTVVCELKIFSDSLLLPLDTLPMTGGKLYLDIYRNDNLCTVDSSSLVYTAPLHGSLSVENLMDIYYTPDDGFEGNDFFEYSFCDTEGENCDTTTAQLTIY